MKSYEVISLNQWTYPSNTNTGRSLAFPDAQGSGKPTIAQRPLAMENYRDHAKGSTDSQEKKVKQLIQRKLAWFGIWIREQKFWRFG